MREPLLRRAAAVATAGLPGFGGWFGPGTPMAPAAPAGTPARQWDFPTGVNLRTGVRGGPEGPTAAQLRALARNCTLIHLAIETRKTQAVRLAWDLHWLDPDEEKDFDAEATAIERLFRTGPDRKKTLRHWMRRLIDDILVLDAGAILIDRDRGGQAHRLRVIDGATIIPRVDALGEEPDDPLPAYQQVVKGIPAVDLTRNDCVFVQLSPRSDRLHGCSPVEQIVVIANLAIRRELSQLQYFTDGTVPESIVAMPESWSASQIRDFETWWASKFENNQGEQRKMRFVPGGPGMQLHQLKPDILKDETDEWLARVVSYAFSLPPTPFVRQMNRASAESQQDAALEEGQLPFIEDLVDTFAQCLFRGWGRDDLAFRPGEARKSDPTKAAEIRASDVQHGIVSINEARADLGRKPIDGLDVPTIQTPAGLVPVTSAIAAPDDADVIDVTPEPQPALPAPDGTPTGNVQTQALSGQQITGLLAILAAVSDGSVKPDAAVQVILVSFPTIEEARARAMVAGAVEQPPEPPPVVPPPPGTAVPDAAGSADAPAPDPKADDAAEGASGLGKSQPARQRRFVAGLSRKQRRLLAGGARSSDAVVAIRTRYAAEVHAVLTGMATSIADQLHPALVAAQAQKAAPVELRKLDEEAVAAAKAIADLHMDGLAVLLDPTQRTLAEVGRMGAEQAASTLKLAVPTLEDFALPNDVVTAFAEDRAAELVGKRVLDDGTVIDNPNPEFAISESTRELIRADVTQAFTDGLTREELAAKLVDSYAFSEQRAETIARNEIGRALVEGNRASWKASGVVTGKESILGSEHDVDDECDAAADAGVIPVDEDFPNGESAPPYHVNCVVSETHVSAAGVTAHYARRYDGEVVRVRVEGLPDLTITPNHPVLTGRGWVAAGELREGDRLVHCAEPAALWASIAPDDDHVEARAEDVRRALGMAGEVTAAAVPLTAEAFHGDGAVDGEVEVVRPARLLRDDREAARDERIADDRLVAAAVRSALLAGAGDAASLVEGDAPPTDGIVRGGHAPLTLLGAGLRGLDPVRLAHAADRPSASNEQLAERAAVAAEALGEIDAGSAGHVLGVNRGQLGVGESAPMRVGGGGVAEREPGLREEALHDLVGDAEALRELADRFTSHVRLVEIAELSRGQFVGHVYNLETRCGWYVAGWLLVHNCVCDILPSVIETTDGADATADADEDEEG